MTVTKTRRKPKPQNLLDIRRTPDPKVIRDYAPRARGKRLNMGVCQFWAYIFELNESLPKAKRMTDAEIKRQFCEEFPDRTAAQRLLAGEVTINHHRQLYNLGRYTRGHKPAKPSNRYTVDGVLANPRTGKPETSAE